MALLLGSTSVAAAVGVQSENSIRSTFLSGSEASRSVCRSVRSRPSLTKVRTAAGGSRIHTTCTIQINRPSPAADQPASPGRIAPLKAPSSTTNKGWTDAMDLPDQRLVSQLRVLATVASDRSEMHHVLSVQRDNWNTLFHSTVTMASVSAAVAAALNGAEQALGLSVVASLLGLGVAALMALVNFFQPSQLAEEQRHASRFFQRLAMDIEATLQTDPRLRPEASLYLKQKLGTLHALDTAFPLPLTPIVLQKFPAVVQPSILSCGPAAAMEEEEEEEEERTAALPQDMGRRISSQSTNGWTATIEKDLEQTSQLLHTADIPMYVDMATGVNHLNKGLAIASTVMAVSGVVCNVVDAMPGLRTSVLGAALTVAAFFAYSLSHAVQLGAAYETYRNCAGFYADVERSIESALRVPVEQREDGKLFLQKIALQLGRNPAQSPLVPRGQEKAGTLF